MKRLAIFDLDNTIYQGYCQNDLAKFLFTQGKISFGLLLRVLWWIFLKKIGHLDNEAAYAKALVLLKGRDLSQLREEVKNYFGKVGKAKINVKAYSIIKKLKQDGFELLLATEAMDFVASEFVRHLGFDYLIATKPEVINEKISGRLNGKVIFGKNKKQAIKLFCKEKGFYLKNSFIYGGRIGDRFILELSPHAHLINPDNKTKQLAKSKKWRII